jgi:hypothetical protein
MPKPRGGSVLGSLLNFHNRVTGQMLIARYEKWLRGLKPDRSAESMVILTVRVVASPGVAEMPKRRRGSVAFARMPEEPLPINCSRSDGIDGRRWAELAF